MLETEPQIVEAYVKTGKVKMVYHHLLDFGERSLKASEAAECAGEQGRFWEMHQLLYQRQDDLWDGAELAPLMEQFAAELELDRTAFSACLASGRYSDKVKADHEAAKAAGVVHRPTFDINGRRLVGAQPFAQFEQAIEAALANQ